MTELQAFLSRSTSLGLHVSHNPNDTYSFVGNVPLSLAYDGPAVAIQTGLKHGFGLVRNKVRKLVWPSAEEAWNAAKDLGYPRCQVKGCNCNAE